MLTFCMEVYPYPVLCESHSLFVRIAMHFFGPLAPDVRKI